jgi:hypothetical protein
MSLDYERITSTMLAIMTEPFSRRQLLVTTGLALLWPRALRAAEPRPTLAELIAHSDCCVIGRSIAAEARWVVLGGARRIVTTHRVLVDDVLDGDVAAGQTLSVRTLGGSVDGLTQRVFGEAAIVPHEPSLLFLLRAEPRLYVVAGMAGGHFALRPDARGAMRLHGGADGSAGVAVDPGAAAVLEGRSLTEARQLVGQAAQRLHAR